MKTRFLIVAAIAAFGLLTPFVAHAEDAAPASDAKPKGGKAAAAFAAADKNGDGKFDLAEFTDFSKARLGADAAKAKFGTLDVNHDGFVTREELRTGMKGPKKDSPEGGEKKE